MRLILALPLLALAGCNVDNDSANDSVRLEYDQNKIEKAGRAIGEAGAAVGNVAASTGRAVKNEVGDIDVDVDVRRDRTQGEAANRSETE
ncbi:MAG TPA: hypothetical protein VFQ67_06690 [Allosphingosinicella sp.]|jgi:hypothetical protein|nr:hypothetical protein [Allosphingosinicella sp.]